jgi:magnesium transporter
MVRILTWGASGLREVPPNELAAVVASGTPAWIDITGPDDDEARLMREVLRFHPLAIEDTRNQRQRPKVEEYPDHLFLILNPGEVGGEDLEFRELDVFLGSSFVATVHPEPEPVLAEAQRRLARVPPEALTPGYVVYTLLDTVVDSYFPLLDGIGDEIEDLEDLVLERPDQETLNRLFNLKRQLVVLRKVVAPQRDAMSLLTRRDLRFIDQSRLAYHLRDVHDHLLRVSDMVDTFRDLLSSGIDLYMSSVSNRLNRVVNRLTVVTIVVGVLAVITGFYGMNFERTWPPFEVGWGVPFALGLMSAAILVIVSVVRWLRWV